METDIHKTIILKVERAVFRLKSFLSAVLSSLCCSHETHPAGSNSHGCLTLHFAKNGNERKAKSLKPTLSTAEYRVILTLILFCICFIAGCSSNIDKQKFREIKSAARAIDEAAGDTTLSFNQFSELLGKLTEELSKATVIVSTKEEKALLKSYKELLTIYQDSAILWEYKIESSQYEWIPKGSIYVDEKLRPVVEKYHFSTESHIVELTNHHFESVSTDSIRTIWNKAHEQLKKI